MALEGATNTEAFAEYVLELLGPTPRLGQLLIS